MLQAASADRKKAADRGNSGPQAADKDRVSLVPLARLGNQATLRLMRRCDCGSPECDCDMADDRKKEEKKSPRTALHRAAASPDTEPGMPQEAPPIVEETLRSSGELLNPGTRAFFENRFHHDFSGVRIHTDTRAAQSARAVRALAYTVGDHIAFAPGRFAPETREGRRLLAHELAHTIQQSGAMPISKPLGIAPSASPEERTAEAAGRAVEGPGGALPHAATTSVVQRDPDPSSPGAAQPAAGAAPSATAATAPQPQPGESYKIAEFDSDSPSKRPWNLKQLSTDIYKALTASPRAYVRIFGVHPVKAGEDDPTQAAMDRALLVKRALSGWLGPQFSEDRYDASLADGSIGDPQIQVWIDFQRTVLSNPENLPGPPGPARPPGPPGSGGLSAAAPNPDQKQDSGKPNAPPMPVAGALNYAWHVNLSGPKGTSRDRTLQLTFGDSNIVQLSYNLDTGQSQILGGYQWTQNIPLPAAFVNLTKNWIKVQSFEQILAGVAAGGATASGSIAIAQPSAGGQVVIGNGNATVSVQVAGSVTLPSAGSVTAEVNVTPTFSFSF